MTTLPPSQCRKSRKSGALTYRNPSGHLGLSRDTFTFYRVYFPEVKRRGRDDHSPPSNAEVKNKWSHTFSPPYAFMAWTGTLLFYDSLKIKEENFPARQRTGTSPGGTSVPAAVNEVSIVLDPPHVSCPEVPLWWYTKRSDYKRKALQEEYDRDRNANTKNVRQYICHADTPHLTTPMEQSPS